MRPPGPVMRRVVLPLTLAVTQAVMLRAGQTTYAVPSVMIEQVQEYKAQAYSELTDKGEVVWKDNHYPLRSLLPLLGEVDTPTPLRQIPVLLLKSGVQRAAERSRLLADALGAEERERRALAEFRSEGDSGLDGLRWLWHAHVTAGDLWEDEIWDVLTALQGKVAA